LGSFSMLGLGRGTTRYGGGSVQESQLLHFQCLVRVLEACLDAQEQQQHLLFVSGRGSGGQPATSPFIPANPVCFTLDDWAELVDTVEQYWPLFGDHGASTTGLLVQFTALALELTNGASNTSAVAEPGSRLTNSLRRLRHLQTDRTLLQTRVFALCAEAVKTLCALENTGAEAETAWQRGGPWWHRPQELVRLSQARRRIEAYECRQPATADHAGSERGSIHSRDAVSAGGDNGHRVPSNGFAARPGASVRSTRLGTPTRPTPSSSPLVASATSSAAAAAAGSRWIPRLSNSWWSSSAAAPLTGGGAGTASSHAAGVRGGSSLARVGMQLGTYVTCLALRQTTATAAGTCEGRMGSLNTKRSPGNGSSSSSNNSLSTSATRSPALVSAALQDVLEIFETVCSAASSSDALTHLTAFAWWVRDVICHQHGRRSLHDLSDMASLLGIAELCLAYPDGTQTVLAEIMKCLQRSAHFLWQVGGSGASSHFTAGSPTLRCASALWPRACQAVADTLPLTTVRSEAERTLRALVSTAQQALPTRASDPAREEDAGVQGQLQLHHRRYGVLILACLLLQQPNGCVTPAFSAQLRELVFAVPFSHIADGPNEVAAAVRALYLFTHARMKAAGGSRGGTVQQTDDVVCYLLDQVTCLFSPSAEVESSVTDDDANAALSRSLASLSTTERQLLRSALREVRTSAAKGVRSFTFSESTFNAVSRADEPAVNTMESGLDSTALDIKQLKSPHRDRVSHTSMLPRDALPPSLFGEGGTPSTAHASCLSAKQHVHSRAVSASPRHRHEENKGCAFPHKIQALSHDIDKRPFTL
jgi:hypothetical protein